MLLIDNYIRTVTQNYFCFDGRMQRVEYWLFVLANLIILFVLAIIMALLSLIFGMNGQGPAVFFGGGAIVYGIFVLAMLLPSLGAQVRRLHDVDLSGWLVLLYFIPYLNVIFASILLALLALQAHPNGAKYGPYR
ncbi:DUF805 domain-containing protein [Acidithiobacillus marinus]|nr:DUF805 domain-containing protein [Acidithiobacillus marinus]